MLMMAGGAAGVAAVLYYLLREEPEGSKLVADVLEKKEERRVRVDDVTKEEVQQILNDIVDSQEKMKVHMKELTRELLQKSLSFEETYQRIREVEPDDPLEKYGLSMNDFDQLLNKHQNDPQIREGIGRIMGVSSSSRAASDQDPVIAVSKVVEVHKYMLEELEKSVKKFTELPKKESFDLKTVTLAVQAVVGAHVEEKFSLTSEDIERAVINHHSQLATNQEFATVNMRMQETMARLMQPGMGS